MEDDPDEVVPSLDNVTLETLGENVLKELNRRLGSARLAKELPGTALVQIAKDVLRLKAEQQKAESGRPEAETASIREMIETAGLPPKRKWKLVQDELERNRLEREDLMQLVDELRRER